MKANYAVTFFLALVLILIVCALAPFKTMGETSALAQQTGLGEVSIQEGNAPSVDITPTMSYQGKLVENGSPVTGSRSMVFRLYDASAGGTLYWAEGPKAVTVSNGMFSVTLGDTATLDMSIFTRKLYLEIQVGSTFLPRQLLQGSPYAFSLMPGADVKGSTSDSTIYAGNSGSGHALSAEGAGSGFSGSTLFANSTSSGGIALWARNDASNSSDAAVVIANDGTGDLLKGFGGDGGNDEFSFANDGTFRDKAASYLFVPATLGFTSSSNSTVSKYRACVNLTSTYYGNTSVMLPITLPSLLYGQAVKIEQVRIYYRVSLIEDYIDYTELVLSDHTYTDRYLVNDDTNHTSTSFTSYDVYPSAYNILSADDGFISLALSFMKTEGYDGFLVFCGARLTLRHHPLY